LRFDGGLSLDNGQDFFFFLMRVSQTSALRLEEAQNQQGLWYDGRLSRRIIT